VEELSNKNRQKAEGFLILLTRIIADYRRTRAGRSIRPIRALIGISKDPASQEEMITERIAIQQPGKQRKSNPHVQELPTHCH
jgi:hypothetical protein